MLCKYHKCFSMLQILNTLTWICCFFFSHPPVDKVTNTIKVPLYPARDVPYELQIKAFVGQKTRSVY